MKVLISLNKEKNLFNSPLQAFSCRVRTFRISFTHTVLVSGVGAWK